MLLSFKMRLFLAAMSLASVCFSAAINFAQTPVDSTEISSAADPRFPGATVFAARPNNFADEKSLISELPNQRQDSFAPANSWLDPAFAPSIDFFPGSGWSSALQSDGKILVGGFFKTINGSIAKSLVRLNSDYSIDTAFNAAINGTILTIAVQPNGKILIGGSFTKVNGAARNRIARLNADGSLDAEFAVGSGADNPVYDIKLQSDGKILLGGAFFGINAARSHAIARLNADGSVDTSLTSPYVPLAPTMFDGNVTTSIIFGLTVQPDGKIIIVGDIWTSSGSANTRQVIARLSTNGAVDSSFSPGALINQARAVALQSNGKILLGGAFTNAPGINRTGIARFNPNGSHDASFNTANNANMHVNSISVLPNDSIYIGGNPLLVGGVAGSSVLRMNADGVRDDAFAAGNTVTRPVNSVLSLPNNGVLIAGSITAANDANRNSVAVFNANGSLDAAANFSTTGFAIVRAIARQADGKIIAGGYFNRINGISRSYLTRFNADGSLDANFTSSITASGTITALLIQSDGKILIGGTSLTVGGASRRVVRLNADGSVDSSFTQGTLVNITSPIEFAQQPDGKIVVIYRAISNGLSPRGGIGRLNQDGSLDSSFSNGSGSTVYEAVAVQPDGKIFVGGQLRIVYVSSNAPPDPYSGIFRLNADGTHDRAFRPATSNADNQFSSVYSISLRSDGKVLIGGNLFPNGASNSAAMLRLNADGTRDAGFNAVTISNSIGFDHVEDFAVLPNGKIVIGGLFSTIDGLARQNVARLNQDGSLDAAFIANADDTVLDVEAQNNRVLIGGSFETVNNQPRTALAGLLAGSTAFDFDGDARADLAVFRPSEGNWYFLRSGSGNSFGNSNWGLASDKLAPADYDGDGRTDFAVWRDEPGNPQRANFYILNSSNNTVRVEQFGASGDQPAPNDWDGDGKADLAVYRAGANNTQSRFLYRPSAQPNVDFVSLEFGLGEDKPVVGDYDADGRQDAAVYRPSNSGWYILQSSNNQVRYAQWGLSADKLVPADYDGDGKTDIAVFRDGIWYILESNVNNQPRYEQWGLSDDVPTPADYDGDGRADIAIWRASTGVWWLRQSQSGFAVQQWGATGDAPIPAAFLR